MELQYSSKVLLLSVYPRDLKLESQRNIITPIVIEASVTTAKIWKQLSSESQNLLRL